MEDPLARVYNCYLEGPENPRTAACQAAAQAGGTQQFYDWNGVNRLAGDRHREIIPEGQLCSAGKESHRGLDLARADWRTQRISPDANGNYTFVFFATAPHSTQYFDFYLTKNGYDPTQPLKWSDLEITPFCHITSVTLRNGRYRMTCPLPQNKTGKHLIYNIWQRSDSAEAFYSCIDVEFGSGGGSTATPTAAAPTATPQPGSTATTSPPTPTAIAPSPTRVPTATACQVNYTVTSEWGSGFQTEVTITNNGSAAIAGWMLTWAFPGNQTITSLWNGKNRQTGSGVMVNNEHWNPTINASGGQVSFGFVAKYSGANQSPLNFLLNGAPCNRLSNREAPRETEDPSVYLPLIER